jgi:hypothetical protein
VEYRGELKAAYTRIYSDLSTLYNQVSNLKQHHSSKSLIDFVQIETMSRSLKTQHFFGIVLSNSVDTAVPNR